MSSKRRAMGHVVLFEDRMEGPRIVASGFS